MSKNVTLRSGFFITKKFLSIISVFSIALIASSSFIVSYYIIQLAQNETINCQIIQDYQNTENPSVSIVQINSIDDVQPQIKKIEKKLNITTLKVSVSTTSGKYKACMNYTALNSEPNNRMIELPISLQLQNYHSSVFSSSKQLVTQSERFNESNEIYTIKLKNDLDVDDQVFVRIDFENPIDRVFFVHGLTLGYYIIIE